MSSLQIEAVHQPENALYIRRCHVCGDFNESAGDILKCEACGKSLLPFYYFDKRKVPDSTDNQPGTPKFRDSESGYGPIRGLTVYW